MKVEGQLFEEALLLTNDLRRGVDVGSELSLPQEKITCARTVAKKTLPNIKTNKQHHKMTSSYMPVLDGKHAYALSPFFAG